MTGKTRLARSRLIWIFAAAIVVATLQVWVTINLFSDYAVAHWGVAAVSRETPTSVNLSYQSVVYDGSLPAWFIPGAPGFPVFVVVSGWNGDRDSNLNKAVPPLHRLGYGLLCIDLAYQIGRTTFGGGQREASEVVAAARWVRTHTGAPVILYGTSAGGLAVLLAGAEGLRPLAIVSDSGLVSERNEVAFNSGLPTSLFAPFELFYPLLSSGGHIQDVGNELHQHPGYDVPTLIVQGTGDSKINWHNGPELAHLTHGTLWLLPGVPHVGAFRSDPERYISRVSAFIRDAEATAKTRQ